MVSTTMLCCWEVRSKGAGWGSMLPGCVWRGWSGWRYGADLVLLAGGELKNITFFRFECFSPQPITALPLTASCS